MKPRLASTPKPLSNFSICCFDMRRSEGWAVLQVSHDLDMVRRTCDRVLCLNRSLRCSGSPDHALSSVQLEGLYGPGWVPYRHRHPAAHHNPQGGVMSEVNSRVSLPPLQKG